ncbi:unnamed protein product [Hymenolepis diminuta]|uniref:39S ribosomal protein L32, mitochondrial n=1 Tax=Hymenolepis diminuta TaxID=6216 RepID=A0A0R3SH08_HYMDI|nr:unnamed protein product [Hymenolepis diminuta]
MRAFCVELFTRARFLISLISGRGVPGLCFVGPQIAPASTKLSNILDIINESIYFAVPKKRHTIERRRMRKFLSFTMDKYKLRNDLITCQNCCSWHPRNSICVNCYDEVRRETNALRASLNSGLSTDQETQFLYDQEVFGKVGAFIHRIDRRRPSWFPASLLGLPPTEPPKK